MYGENEKQANMSTIHLLLTRKNQISEKYQSSPKKIAARLRYFAYKLKHFESNFKQIMSNNNLKRNL
ncbi:hypothetical protein HZS_4008 [Henneguya salminicola]|nr:hypothetical protein HZS_4008 [Henneguya salminicola]